MKPGDVVAIRGDLRKNNNGQCSYTPDQLIDGKYLKHTGHGGIWLGTVKEVRDGMVHIGGGWWYIGLVEVMCEGELK